MEKQKNRTDQEMRSRMLLLRKVEVGLCSLALAGILAGCDAMIDHSGIAEYTQVKLRNQNYDPASKSYVIIADSTNSQTYYISVIEGVGVPVDAFKESMHSGGRLIIPIYETDSIGRTNAIFSEDGVGRLATSSIRKVKLPEDPEKSR